MGDVILVALLLLLLVFFVGYLLERRGLLRIRGKRRIDRGPAEHDRGLDGGD